MTNYNALAIALTLCNSLRYISLLIFNEMDFFNMGIRSKKVLTYGLVISTFLLPLNEVLAENMQYRKTGNIQQSGQRYYHYNALNQLTQASSSGVRKTSVQYHYYATGIQTSEAKSNNVLVHYYGLKMRLVNSVLQGKLGMSAYLLGNKVVARFYSNQTPGKQVAQLYIKNAHLSTVAVIQSQSVSTEQYSAYGQMLLQAYLKQLVMLSLSTNPLLYSGYYNDAMTGLDYLKARYFSTQLKAFLSHDSTDLINRYFYANNNPIMLMDPTGHNAVSRWFGLSNESSSQQDWPYQLAIFGGGMGLIGGALGVAAVTSRIFAYYHGKPVQFGNNCVDIAFSKLQQMLSIDVAQPSRFVLFKKRPHERMYKKYGNLIEYATNESLEGGYHAPSKMKLKDVATKLRAAKGEGMAVFSDLEKGHTYLVILNKDQELYGWNYKGRQLHKASWESIPQDYNNHNGQAIFFNKKSQQEDDLRRNHGSSSNLVESFDSSTTHTPEILNIIYPS